MNKNENPELDDSQKKAGKSQTGVSRRDFLKLSFPSAGGSALASEQMAGTPVKRSASANPNACAMLYDASKCLGCRRCEEACRRQNDLPPEYRPADLSPDSLRVIKYTALTVNGKMKWYPTAWQCMHCVNPTCVSVCPGGALHKTEEGPVLYDESKCIGCQYCVSACPFSVPRFDFATRKIKKCIFCVDRINQGLQPECAEVCPVQALTFGTRDEIISKANDAVAKGFHVRGIDQVGGTSWIYVSDIPFKERGFPDVPADSYPSHSKEMLIPQIGTIAVSAAALGIYSLYKRKTELREAKNEDPEN